MDVTTMKPGPGETASDPVGAPGTSGHPYPVAADDGHHGDELLPGETLEAIDAEDARHWLGVYDQLIAFTEQALSVEPPVGPRRDQLLARLTNFRRRRRFWTRQRQAIQSRIGFDDLQP